MKTKKNSLTNNLVALGATPLATTSTPPDAFDRAAKQLNAIFKSDAHKQLFLKRRRGEITAAEYEKAFNALCDKVEKENVQ